MKRISKWLAALTLIGGLSFSAHASRFDWKVNVQVNLPGSSEFKDLTNIDIKYSKKKNDVSMVWSGDRWFCAAMLSDGLYDRRLKSYYEWTIVSCHMVHGGKLVSGASFYYTTRCFKNDDGRFFHPAVMANTMFNDVFKDTPVKIKLTTLCSERRPTL